MYSSNPMLHYNIVIITIKFNDHYQWCGNSASSMRQPFYLYKDSKDYSTQIICIIPISAGCE